MLSRVSKVQHIKATSITLGSVFQIGDSEIFNSLSRALAVQREVETFFNFEGDFSKFNIFTESIPIPVIEEPVTMYRTNFSSCINVPRVRIIGVSAASAIHIGNTSYVNMESRIKHIRQLRPRTSDTSTVPTVILG